MATGADTFPARSGALWPTLNDEELSVATSTASQQMTSNINTSTATSSHQQRLLLSNTSNAQLNDLSVFLASAAATSTTQTNAQRTFLDDLLQDEGDGHQNVQTQSFQLLQSHEDVAVSSAMTDVGVLSDAAFFSLGEEAHRGDQYSSSSSGSPSTPSGAGNSSRLLQLETNYERKKKRAKINRKDLNSRFQELMDILHLKEDRKLNRAKILEKTIEHIENLTMELNALKAGQQPQQQNLQQVNTRKTAIPMHHAQQLHGLANTMAQSMGKHGIAGSVNGAPLLPYNPSWSAAAVGANLQLAPMMWMPCPVVTPSGLLKRAAPGRPADTSNRKRGRVESTESAATMSPVSSSSEAESNEVVATSSSPDNESSVFEWSAQEIPTLLSYCDAWTLVSVMGTSRELRRAAQNDKLWGDLCRARWRIPADISIPQPIKQWQQWHDMNRIPGCSTFTRGGQLFASGRAKDISVWGMLSHRSNGHTTRTVLLNGKATVMQVVELYVVVQNLSRARVRVTDCISLTSTSTTSGAGEANSSIQPFTAASGTHLTPTVVAFNTEPCATKDLAGVALQHGDLCVLSVFMACPGLDLEDQFLQRAGWLDMQCKVDSKDGVECVSIRAACQDHNDCDRTREKALLAVRQDASS